MSYFRLLCNSLINLIILSTYFIAPSAYTAELPSLSALEKKIDFLFDPNQEISSDDKHSIEELIKHKDYLTENFLKKIMTKNLNAIKKLEGIENFAPHKALAASFIVGSICGMFLPVQASSSSDNITSYPFINYFRFFLGIIRILGSVQEANDILVAHLKNTYARDRALKILNIGLENEQSERVTLSRLFELRTLSEQEDNYFDKLLYTIYQGIIISEEEVMPKLTPDDIFDSIGFYINSIKYFIDEVREELGILEASNRLQC